MGCPVRPQRKPALQRLCLPALACALIAAVLAACGGGGNAAPPAPGTTPAPPRGPTLTTFTIDPATVNVTARQVSAAFMRYDGSETPPYNPPAECRTTTAPFDVLETLNTTVYPAAGTPADYAQAVARHAEAAVLTLRERLGTTASIGFWGERVRICVWPGGTSSAGSHAVVMQGNARLQVSEGDGGSVGALLMHELTHLAQARALGCRRLINGPAYERWFLEGMALRMAAQDLPRQGQLATLKTLFTGATASPFDEISSNSGNVAVYPGFRLAIDTLLVSTGRSERDLYRFLQLQGERSGCPDYGPGLSVGNGWKPAFDEFFGSDLRGTGPLGSAFWNTASSHALP